MIQEVPNVGGLYLLPNFLTEDEERTLLTSIDTEGTWTLNRQKDRRVQMYGIHHDDRFRVQHDAEVTLLPLYYREIVIPKILGATEVFFPEAHKKYMRKLNKDHTTELFVNEYCPTSSLPYHTDHPMTYEEIIVGVSIGCSCVLRFRVGNAHAHCVELPPRSAYFMTGTSRIDAQHGMDVGDCLGPRRVSLTFRVVRESMIVRK